MMKISDQPSFHFKSWFPVLCLVGFLFQDVGAAFESTYTVSTSASIPGSSPNGISYDPSEDKIIVALFDINKVGFIKDGVTTTIYGSPTPWYGPYGLWQDPTSKNVFVASWGSHVVAKIDPTTQLSTKFAGTGSQGSVGDGGPATSATLNAPSGIFGDTNGNVFVAEEGGQRIRKINKSDNKISTVAGGGALGDGNRATSSLLDLPIGVFVDTAGDIFVTSWNIGLIKSVSASTGIMKTIAGGGSSPSTANGVVATSTKIVYPFGIWGDSKGNMFVTERGGSKVTVIAKENNYEKAYLIAAVTAGPFGIFGDEASGRLFVTHMQYNTYTVLQGLPGSSRAPSASPSTSITIAPSQTPSISPSAVPSVSPSASPSSQPTIAPSSTPTETPTFAVPEYSLTVSAKSFKYFEVRVFTEANERVFPVSYDLVDCPENIGAVIWGHESTPVTEDTNTCVYGLPRHYWCECPALVNGNKPKLILNFGGTVFDRVELLILDWVDGEVVVSDSANNIVLFSASRAGGPLAGEEFVGYDHLNLLQVAPSVVPTMVPSSMPTTKPSWTPTTKPSIPSVVPTQTPTVAPTTIKPSAVPSVTPSMVPSAAPSFTAQYTITLTAKTFKYFEVRVYTHDNLRIFPVSYELEHCPENAGIAVWNDQTTEDTNTCVYGYPRNFWCECTAGVDVKPKLVLHMGHTVFDRVELLLLNWEDGEVMVTDEANHETFLSATHDGVGNEFVTFGNLNLEHAAAPARRLLRGG